jgi:hypothetical protein
VIGSNDHGTRSWNIAKALYLWAKKEHQERSQECSQGAVGQVVHGDNLLQGSSLREYLQLPREISAQFCESIEDMAPGERDDDMELINAEFESMIEGLNLDQSSPRTYLDDLDDLAALEAKEIYQIPRTRRGLHGSITHVISTIKSWWRKPGNDDNDGAVV